ncbi:hypothetical protein, partial [Saliniramus sp.]|uniref:hypothetical protein n=1 Tax=Saliniramus sp. TaxID=2986772 RepID=UPI002C2B7F86
APARITRNAAAIDAAANDKEVVGCRFRHGCLWTGFAFVFACVVSGRSLYSFLCYIFRFCASIISIPASNTGLMRVGFLNQRCFRGQPL